jgi:hypothetical protein
MERAAWRDTGYFWFFDRNNVEIMVKVLNGCAVNSRFWVFAGGLTDVEVEMTIFDTETGAEKKYRNQLGQPFTLVRDTDAFGACTGPASLPRMAELRAPAPEAGSCLSSETALCVSDNRFRIEATWETPNGNRGTARAVRLTNDSGYFWFFDAANVELVTKMLNACSLTGSHWIFTAGLTDVKVDMTVTDTTTGAVKRYSNPQSQPFELVRDIAAFTTCP